MVKKVERGQGASPEQALELMFKLAGAGRITSFDHQHIQWMIDNIREIGPFFKHFLDTQGLRDVSLITKVRDGCETERSLDQTFSTEEQAAWLVLMKDVIQVTWVDILHKAHAPSRTKFRMILLGQKTSLEEVFTEFAIRGCEPATPFEILYLLNQLRRSKKKDFPFVSISNGSPVVAFLEKFHEDGKIVICLETKTPNEVDGKMWSYVGAIR